MGSLAEKLIHFVTKRSIHEFFLNYLPVWILLQFAKGGLIMYLLLLKINLQNLKCRSYWLSYFSFSPPILSYFMLFHPFSSSLSILIIIQAHDLAQSSWKKFGVSPSSSFQAHYEQREFSPPPQGLKQRVKDSPSRVSLLSHPSGCKSLSNLTWDETRKSNIREVLCIFKEFHHQFLTLQILTFSTEKIYVVHDSSFCFIYEKNRKQKSCISLFKTYTY